MWTPEQIFAEVIRGRIAQRCPNGGDLAAWSEAELLDGVRGALRRPVPSDLPPVARALERRTWAAQWLLLLESLDLPAEPRVLEPCAGGGEGVVMALDALFGDRARYTTVNLNRPLAAELIARTRHLAIRVEVIEDNAVNLAGYFPADSLDCACFHHAVNDILQTAVAGRHGLDTRDIDWWPTERKMIEWLGAQWRQDGLASVGLPELTTIIESAAQAVRPGGHLVFDHWTYEGHLGQDWFPGDLFQDLIPLARQVALSLRVPLEEITPPALDRRWWMVLRRPGCPQQTGR